MTDINDAGDTELVPGVLRYLTPSFADIIFLLILSFALVIGTALVNRDGDLAKHLRIGERTIEIQEFPAVDIWSFTKPGTEMVPFEWASQVTLAATEGWLGFDGLVLLTALLIAAPFLIIYRWLVRRGAPVGLSFFMIVLATATSIYHWAARPHVFSWIFIAMYVVLLEDLRKGQRQRVWALVPLALLWVNFHGAWVVGLVLIGIHLIGGVIEHRGEGIRQALRLHRIRHLGIVLTGCFAVSFFNPSSFETVIHPFAHVLGDNYIIGVIGEFASPDFHNPLFWPFLLMIVFTICVSQRSNPTGLLLTLFWTAAGLYSLRHIPLYAIVVAPILVATLTPAWSTKAFPRLGSRLKSYATNERKVVGGSLSVVLMGLVTFSLLNSPGSEYGLRPDSFPVEAMSELATAPPGERLLHEFTWGGYLVYCCHPDIPVFIDGQVDHYGAEITRDHLSAIEAEPVWRDIFEKYEIDWVLLGPGRPLAQVLTEAGDWQEIYRDATAVAFAPSP